MLQHSHGGAALALAVVTLAAAAVMAINPYLLSANTDFCFPLDTPHSRICFPDRCPHLLLNGTVGKPGAFQVYPRFKCNVTTWYEYGKEIPSRACLRPLCSCGPGYRGGSCYPTQYNSCAKHVCTKIGKL